jgi:hypothetical protein
MRHLILILTILTFGCRTTTKVATIPISENNKDVLILATLISDHLKRTNARTLDLSELVQKDTLKRIINNFEKIELKPRGGYISVYYKFSKTRDDSKIQLTDREKKLWLKWASGNFDGQYNGEIRLAYGERFYHLKKIIVQKD